MRSELYEQDLYAWAISNARTVRDRRFDALDREHIAEELESMGASERRELLNRLQVPTRCWSATQRSPRLRQESP